jgi:nucleotide-binding universal stress UspA family protein
MRTMVVGVDGSVASLTALDWAAAIATASHASLVVVNAFTPVQSEKPPGVLERLIAEQRAVVDSWCGDRLTDIPHQIDVSQGDPRDRLLEAVDHHGADLLVVSSTGASGAEPGLLRLGSVAEYLARNAKIPLAVIPPDSPTAVRRAVVAVDGSEHSRAAAAWLARASLRDGQEFEVVAVHVDEGDDPIDLDDAARPLGEGGVAFDPLLVSHDDAATGILEAARSSGADLVVVGMRGANPVLDLRLGGVAFEVLRETTLPLVLVPPVSSVR